MQARYLNAGSFTLSWSSFADSFKSNVYDRCLVSRPFLIDYDNDRELHYTYIYAEFGTVVQRVPLFSIARSVAIVGTVLWR